MAIELNPSVYLVQEMAIEPGRPTYPAREIEDLQRRLAVTAEGYRRSFAVIKAIDLKKSKPIYQIADKVCFFMLLVFMPIIKLLSQPLANRNIRPL